MTASEGPGPSAEVEAGTWVPGDPLYEREDLVGACPYCRCTWFASSAAVCPACGDGRTMVVSRATAARWEMMTRWSAGGATVPAESSRWGAGYRRDE